MTQHRDITFDFLKSIAIFLVIWGHTMALGPTDVYHNVNGHWIVLVNMPLFMFIVGFFSISSEKRTIKETISKKWHSLLIPTLIYGLVTSIPRLTISNQLTSSEIIRGGVIACLIEPYWFIWAIMCCLLYYKCFNVILSRHISTVFLAVISWTILMLMPHTIESPLLSKVQSMYPFFMLGLIFRKFRIFDTIKRVPFISGLSSFGIFATFYVILAPKQNFYHFQYMSTFNWLVSYLMMLFVGMAGIIICYLLCNKMSRLNIAPINWLNEIGQYTLAIYLEQTIIFSFLNFAGVKLSNDIIVLMLAILIFTSLAFATKIVSHHKLLSKLLLGK